MADPRIPICTSLYGFLEEHASPITAGHRRIYYAIAYRSGLPLILLPIALGWTWNIIIGLKYMTYGAAAGKQVNWIFESGQAILHEYLPLILAMVWLTGMVVLAPQYRRLAWIVFFTWVLSELPWSVFSVSTSGPYLVLRSDYLTLTWIPGVVLMLGLFAALYLRQWKAVHVLAYCLAGGMLVSGITLTLSCLEVIQYPDIVSTIGHICSLFTACPFCTLPVSPYIVLELLDVLLVPFPNPDQLSPAVHFFTTLVWLAGWVYLVYLFMQRVILRREWNSSEADRA